MLGRVRERDSECAMCVKFLPYFNALLQLHKYQGLSHDDKISSIDIPALHVRVLLWRSVSYLNIASVIESRIQCAGTW